jgi:hypothetical protein
MTTEETLKKMREQNVDVEITCVFSNREEGQVKIGYRYLISAWDKNNVMIKNIYTDDVYNSYEAAVIAAITRARSNLEITL